jgi:hypothetical protein
MIELILQTNIVNVRVILCLSIPFSHLDRITNLDELWYRDKYVEKAFCCENNLEWVKCVSKVRMKVQIKLSIHEGGAASYL